MTRRLLTQESLDNWAAKHISAAFCLMYGLVPYLVDHFDLFPAPYAEANLAFSLALTVIIYILPQGAIKSNISLSVTPSQRNGTLTTTIFFASAVVFYNFPWHADRESAGASISAIFRALWLVTTLAYIKSTEKEKMVVMALTIILMYIDQSRTYFLLSLIIVALSSKHKLKFITFSIVFATLLAAIRSEASDSGADLALYGIVGEGYNATRAVGQVYESSGMPIDSTAHIAKTLLQPIIFPLEFALSKIYGEAYKTQEFYIADLVDRSLYEEFNPMGGWYIVADFMYYGNFGIPLLAAYIFITWAATKAVFDTPQTPIGSVFLFIAIKSNPYIYWKFVYYVIGMCLAYKILFIAAQLLRNTDSTRNSTQLTGASKRNILQ